MESGWNDFDQDSYDSTWDVVSDPGSVRSLGTLSTVDGAPSYAEIASAFTVTGHPQVLPRQPYPRWTPLRKVEETVAFADGEAGGDAADCHSLPPHDKWGEGHFHYRRRRPDRHLSGDCTGRCGMCSMWPLNKSKKKTKGARKIHDKNFRVWGSDY